MGLVVLAQHWLWSGLVRSEFLARMLRLTFTDMLFTGDGEAFNVCFTFEGCVGKDFNVGLRLDNSSKTYHLTLGQV